MIAHELFGAVAGERGQLWKPATLKTMSDRCAVQNAERKRIWNIENAADRVCEIIGALQRPEGDPRRISVGFGVDAVANDDATALPELIGALAVSDGAVRSFAAYSLHRRGEAAAEAIPALVACVRDPQSRDAYVAVHALSAMGTTASEGLAAR